MQSRAETSHGPSHKRVSTEQFNAVTFYYLHAILSPQAYTDVERGGRIKTNISLVVGNLKGDATFRNTLPF